jgi:murein DD-endopeptidase MepM/ murein hydrolase activator NlpD
MPSPWHEINDPGKFFKPKPTPADNTRVADKTDPVAEPKKEPPPTEVKLSEGKFLQPDGGLKFNDKCKVQVNVEYLRETSIKKITFSLFCTNNGKTEEMKPDKDGFEKNGIAEAEFQLFYPEDYKQGDKADFFIKASHRRGEKVIESKKLTLPQKQEHLFPMKNRPPESYKEEPRSFGSIRDNGTRKHAGCDLYAPIGTDILAVADGTVVRGPYEFAGGTYAFEIDHGSYLLRYTEIDKNTPAEIRVGCSVKKGQVIGHVGRFVAKDGTIHHMLHFEMYSNMEKGPLTNKSNPPFKRRKDLEDPTSFLDEAVLPDK